MSQNTQHTPAFPTFPVQNQFGQTIINFGSSKLEMGAFIVAAGIAKHVDQLLPETVADMSIEIAKHIVEKCDALLMEETKPSAAKIITDGV